MINATANEILSSLIGSKKSELREARHKLSMYSDLVDRLEMEISALENASEMVIGDPDSKKSIIYKLDPNEPAIDCYLFKGQCATSKEESNEE